MQRSRTQNPPAKIGCDSVVAADPATSCPVTRAKRTSFLCNRRAGPSRCSQVQAGSAVPNRVVPDAREVSPRDNKRPTIPSSTKNATSVTIKGSVSAVQTNPDVINHSVEANPARAYKNMGSAAPAPTRAVMCNMVLRARVAQPATGLDKLPTKKKSTDVLKEKASAPSSSKVPHEALGKSQPKKSCTVNAADLRDILVKKATAIATTTTTTTTPLKVRRISSVPSSSQQHQEPPITDHIKFRLSDIFEDAPLEPLGEKCQICGIDLAFTLAGNESSSREPPVHAVLPCSHCYHNSCLEFIFGPSEPSQIPSCVCCSKSEE